MFRQKDYIHLSIPHVGELTPTDFVRFYDDIYITGANAARNAPIAEEILRDFPRVCVGFYGEIEFLNDRHVRIQVSDIRDLARKPVPATIEGPPESAIPLFILSQAEMGHPSDLLHRFVPPTGWEIRFARACCAFLVFGRMMARVRICRRNGAEIFLREVGSKHPNEVSAMLRIPSEHSAIYCALSAAHDLLAARVIWYGQQAIYRLEQYGVIVETGIHAVDELIRATRAVLAGR